MKRQTKIISLLLSFLMLLSIFTAVPFMVNAAEAASAVTGVTSGTTGDCTWTLDGVLAISGNGKMGDFFWKLIYQNQQKYYVTTAPWGYSIGSVVIYDGVTKIGAYAFHGCTNLTSVTIPDSVTIISASAFNGCLGLTSVAIPDSVTVIGADVFRGCAGLTDLTFGNSLKSIGSGAFENCTGLTSVTIPDPVKSIGTDAFRKCTGLTSITIPDSVTTIGSSAFSGCSGLTSITIPASVTKLAGNAFGGCTNLTIYGYKDSTAEKCANDNNIPFVALDDVPQPTGFTVSGAITSFLSDGEDITVKLYNGETSQMLTVKGNSASYSFADIPAGDYTLSVEKKDHAPRTYEITVSADTEQDMKLHPMGDINGDGKITNMDFSRANSHARGMTFLTGYALTCADVIRNDGEVTNMDASRINSAARGVSPLW